MSNGWAADNPALLWEAEKERQIGTGAGHVWAIQTVELSVSPSLSHMDSFEKEKIGGQD